MQKERKSKKKRKEKKRKEKKRNEKKRNEKKERDHLVSNSTSLTCSVDPFGSFDYKHKFRKQNIK